MQRTRAFQAKGLSRSLVLLLLCLGPLTGWAASSFEATENGRKFLVSLLGTNLDLETTCLSNPALEEALFQDDFRGKLGEGWSWVREDRAAWRVGDGRLEVRIEPGNMWGPQNNARNLLVRPAPEPGEDTIEVDVNVENKPTSQYEQVDLVWYYDDSNMVKVGLELVDGKLSVVMGREENDKTRTIAIIPVESTSVRLRHLVRKNQIRGQFRVPGTSDWREVGECSLPTSVSQKAKVSLQFYQGPANAEHWARVSEFRMLRCH